jgi:hypothetical protein
MQANLSQQFGKVLNSYVIDRAINDSSDSAKAEPSSRGSAPAKPSIIDSDEAYVDDDDETEETDSGSSGVNELTMLLMSAHTSKAKAVELYAAKDYRGAYEGQ